MFHRVYHSNHKTYSSHWIASSYLYFTIPAVVDLPKGVAAARHALKSSSGAYKKRQQQLLSQALKKMTPEQKIEADKLTEENYPEASKFRKEAFTKLKELGDISDHFDFDSNQLH
ncbi:MAG: hypothetical protein ABGY95_06455 [Rubritalea sp.]|uniref:hypothetical protein n=1 Tax=Rubritalea sp. TaxID=2109375 RepID=UPI00324206E9